MFGTTRTLASGRVQARYTLPNGQQASAGTYPDKQVARAALLQLEAEQARGITRDVSRGRIPFDRFMQEFQAFRVARAEVKPRTLAINEESLRLYLLPAFGRTPLETITPETVDRWFESLPRSSSRRNAYALLSKAMRYAVKWGYLRQTPCLVEGAFADTSAPRPTFTVIDFRAILAHVPERYRVPFRVMFAGHFRIGELIALDWADYDRRTGSVSVTKQTNPAGQTIPTKTGQHRSVRLLQDGISALSGLTPAVGAVPIFKGVRGGRIDRRVLRRVWDNSRKAAGLPEFRIHDLRHVSLTLVAESGASLKDIQTRGGHASVNAAMRYQHTTHERDADVARRVDALLA